VTATWSYNGFDMGGTDVGRIVANVSGLDMPSVRTGDAPLGGADGALGGLDSLDARTIDMTLELAAETSAELHAMCLALSAATARRSDDLPLTFQLDPSMPAMRAYCRPRRRNIPASNRHAWGNVTCELQLYCPDPLIYSDAEQTGTTAAPTTPAGFTFNRAYPYNFGSPGSTDVISAYNAGDADAPWTAVIYGPCTSPTIIGPGGQLRWQGTLTAGESLYVDAHPTRQTVLVGGTSSQFSLLSDDSTWWLLPPGVSNIVLDSGDGGGVVDFAWRSAWMAAT
jgi:hypothetical protein